MFPSRQKGKHVTGGLVNKQWARARKKAGLPEDLALYCARQDFGTYVFERTGNIDAVMNSMGHSDVKTAMTYQHPELNVVLVTESDHESLYGTPPKPLTR